MPSTSVAASPCPKRSGRIASRRALFAGLLPTLVGLALICLTDVAGAVAIYSYRAHSIDGDQAPPSYGLRLDGFYDSQESTEVTFHFDQVTFDRYLDGTALLSGEVTIAEFNHQNAPGSEDLGPGIHAGERYLLNVHFVQITDPPTLAHIEQYRSDWSYFNIDPSGVELQRIGVAGDSTHLWLHPSSLTRPFQVGPGANGINQNFGAAGWLSFQHHDAGKVSGGGPGTYLDASELLMDLERTDPMPCDSIRTVDNFTLQFLGVHYDFIAGTSRWDYELTWDGSPPQLSQLTIELCREITDDDILAVTPSNGSVGRDGSTGLYGIKWDPPPHMPAGEPVTFSFTLDRLLEVDNAGFFPKAAVNYNYALICGPSLDCSELVPPCTLNQPPFVQAPPVPEPLVCVPESGTVCLPGWTFGDPEGDSLTFNTMGSGTFDPGTGTFCTNVNAAGQYTMTLIVSDPCGATDTTSLTFEVLGNDPPAVTLHAESILICLVDTVCLDFEIVDENPGSLQYQTNFGYFSDGQLCFVADTAGEYTVILTATDECGQAGSDTAVVHVQANAPPEWTHVPDTSVVQCAPGDSICFSFEAIDPDGDPITYSAAFLPDSLPEGTKLAFANGATQCFVPSGSGVYRFVVHAKDSCNAYIEDTAVVRVTVNTPPELVFSLPDTTLYLCDPDTLLCFDVSALDADGDAVALREILNPGSFDLETGQVCFNPDSVCFDNPMTTDTTICLIFGASDPCGPEVVDSICITIVINRPPVVFLPIGQSFTICEPGWVCLTGVVAMDPDGDSLVFKANGGQGTYENGELCFFAIGPGTYNVPFEATDPCGASAQDTTQVTVLMNSAPTVALGEDRSVTLCAPGEICVDGPLVDDANGDLPRLDIEGATQQGDQLCFVATGPGVYTIVVRATDSCGAFGVDTLQVNVEMNEAPRVLIRLPRPLTLCDIDTTLCYPVMASDLDGPPVTDLKLVKTDLHFWSLSGQTLCLDASVAMAGRTQGTFQAIVEATDNCGAKGRDTIQVQLKANQAPHAQLPADTDLVLCEPDEVCVGPIGYGDSDQSVLDVQVQGGVLVEDRICINVTGDTTALVVLTVRDSCGLTAVDSMLVEVSINRLPQVVLPDFNTLEVCTLDTICVDGIEGLDPDVGRLPAELLTGPGTFDPQTGRLCFVPTQSGPYTFTFAVDDGCAVVTAEWTVQVTVNRPPAFETAPEVSEFACLPGDTVCLDFSAVDPDGEVLTYKLLSGTGWIDSMTGQVCFLPNASGTFEFTVAATDSCGAEAQATGSATVQINRPPALQFSSGDTALYLCDPDTLLCFTVTATDPDGGALVISEVQNPGDFNPLTGEFCFNPSLFFSDPGTHDTTICVIFAAMDTCGAATEDSLCLQITRNRAPVVDLGPDRSLLLCAAGPVCVDLSGVALDLDGDPLVLTAEAPAYVDNGSVCIDVASPGIQRIVLCATDSCGASSCDTLFLDVAINTAPQVILPADTTVVACLVEQVCLGPVSIVDADLQDSLEITVTGIAQLVGDELCFQPTGDGTYTFVVTATDRCGASGADTISVHIELNDPPALVFSSPDTSITLCHTDTNLCFSVTAVDPDGESLEIEEVLVPGSFDPATGIFCFNPDSVFLDPPLSRDTTICLVFRVTDACGVTTTDSLCVELRVNTPPELHFSLPDTTMYICRIDTLLCFNVTATDAEGDSVIIREILNPGEFYPEIGLVCFQPVNVCYPNQPCSAPPTCIIFEAEDECGNIVRDSVCIELFANVRPVVVAPDLDTNLAVACQQGDEVCISPVYGQDIEDGTIVVTAPGAIYDPRLQTLCFNADTSGVYLIEAVTVDDCGASDTATITVRVDVNLAPVVQLPGDTVVALCGPDTVCFPVTVTDLDNTWTVTQVLGPAYFDQADSSLCVYVTGGDPIAVGLVVTDACGVSDSAQFQIQPTVNTAPQVTLPADYAVRICAAGSYCLGPVEIIDLESNLSGPPQVTGGTYDPDSGTICIEVASSGLHTVIVSATDSCGLSGADTVVVDITLNRAPVTHFSSPDTSLFLCTPDTVLCFTFSGGDPDGDLVLLNEILNPGTFDPLTGEFCFNPMDVCFAEHPDDYDTTLCLIFSATDSCGLEVRDTLCIQVTANAAPLVVAPADTSITTCNSDSICLNAFVVSDPNGDKDQLTVTSFGPAHAFDPVTGRLCFVASPGTYRFGVTATDRCGLASTDSVIVTVETGQPPVVTLPADFSTTLCADSELCIPVTATDPDPGDILTVIAISPLAHYDEETSSICLAPDTAGVYLVIAQATDPCGLSDQDTVRVTVTLNRPPVWISVPQIDSTFCAPPGQICFGVSAQDPDGQNLIYVKLQGPGTMDSLTGLICFNPGATSGQHDFVVTASDPCGPAIVDTATVMVRINQPPIFAAVRDTLVVQCQPTPICFPPLSATDPDGGALTYTLLEGTGTLTGGIYCFTPDTSGLYRIRVKVADACNLADTVMFFASVRLNQPPVLQLPSPSTHFLCAVGEICVGGISASDVDGGPISITKTSGPGTFNPATGQVCFTPSGAGTFHFDFVATDSCGAQTTGQVTVTVLLNRAPTLDVPDRISGCMDSLICIPVGGIDPDIGNRLSITQLSGPAGAFSPNPLVGPAPLSGEWCWTAPAAGSYLVVFQVSDSCGATAVDTTRIDVSEFCDTLCFAASIPDICPDTEHPNDWLYQGIAHEFPVMVTPSRSVGAFDFLIGYDASALTLQNVQRGADISAWEFFTYRILDPNTECSGLCPSGLVRIVGIADINNGAPITDPSQMQPSTEPREYARIVFQVSNDRTLGGQFVPVKFWWNDCGDNTFSSPEGDLYVSSTIDPDTCVGDGAKQPIEACATFKDGGGCIPTASDIDDRGDLNMNGFGYEIADAVLYSNYFIFGPVVFDPDPIRNASQVAASDVNADGSPLTVADLVFLIRIILGLEQPIHDGAARVAPAGEASVFWKPQGDEAHLVLESSSAAGALAIEARLDGPPQDVRLSDLAVQRGMELKWHAEGDRLRILIYSMTGKSLEPGSGTLVMVKGGGSLPETLHAQVSDEHGRVVTVQLKASPALPTAFELEPNFPNPFNPETEVRFTLHQAATVDLFIYNLLGQPVTRLVTGQTLPAGSYQYRWHARDERGASLPSGVYLYRLTADGISETRKMLLLR